MATTSSWTSAADHIPPLDARPSVATVRVFSFNHLLRPRLTTMEYRLLGGWGLKVPFLSLGTGTFGGTPGLFDAFDIIGARNEEQLRQNLGAIGWNLTKEQIAKLDAASAVTKAYPYFHQDNFAERNPFPV